MTGSGSHCPLFCLPRLKKKFKPFHFKIMALGRICYYRSLQKMVTFLPIQLMSVFWLIRVRLIPLRGPGFGKLTLPKIISFLWLCMHKSVPVRDVLADRSIVCSRLLPSVQKSSRIYRPLIERVCVCTIILVQDGGISFIHGQAHSRVLKIGSMRTVLASGPGRIIFRGVLFFLLPFGIFGNIETKLYLIMLPLISICTATVLPKLWIFSIVLAL